MKALNIDELKRFLHSAPVNIFFKDVECKYYFASEICELLSIDKNDTIIGKTELEIQAIPELGKFYYEDDKKIIKTGEGSQYISEIPTKDKGTLYFEIKKNAVRDENGKIIGIVGIVDDVTERVRLEKKVEELSLIDSLTGVYNRNFLNHKIEEKKAKLKLPFTVIMSDCNYLKKVNDLYGHEYGDVLLRIVATTIKEELPEECAVVRMGGDEFMILCNNMAEYEANILIEKIQNSLQQKSKNKIPLSIAMGSYTIEKGEVSLKKAYSEADKNMYANKKKNR